MTLIIAFHPASSGGLSFRGSEDAMFQYALFNVKLLGNKSIICLKEGAFNEPLVLKKFQEVFECIISYNDTKDLEDKLVLLNVDAMYTIRYGRPEEPMLSKIPILVHCVYDMSTPHGLVYAGVSDTVARKFNNKVFVPHI